MKKQILSEEFKRMQKLAGLIKEYGYEEGSGYEETEYKEGSGATPEEIEKTIAFYNTEDGQFMWKYGGGDDFAGLSQGYNGDLKAKRYPNWTKADFKKVLDTLPKV